MLNQCNFIGRLGKDPETKYTANQDAISNFSIACSEKYKSKSGEMEEKTEWVNCTAFGRLGEICSQYLTKGSLVYISGKMNTRKWEDNSGNTRYSTGINVREMKMLGSKGEQSGGQQSQQQTQPPQQPPQAPSDQSNFSDFDQDVPF